MLRSLATFLLLFFCGAAYAAEAPLPRTVIALYDDRGGGIRTSYLHTMAEMPLNHLGLNLEYHDIHEALPDLSNRPDVRGVITWFFSDTQMDPKIYLPWAEAAVASGKKYVIMGPMGIAQDEQHYASSLGINKFLSKIGVRLLDGWVQNPFDVTYAYRTPDMFLTRSPFDWTRPSYRRAQAVGDDMQVHLAAHKDSASDNDSDLVITGPAGGYIAAEYIFRTNERNGDDVNQWEINPFEFFRLSFATDDLPKPDTTTIAGRRIYYSHIDGDGWNNVTRVEEFKDKPTLSSEVVMDKAVKPYPDLPVTLTVIAADVDPQWAATKDSRGVAQSFYALPQVEAGSHTYSHPFYWQFFANGDISTEVPYLSRYDHPTWKPAKGMAGRKEEASDMPTGYRVPRAYAYKPFNLKQEIEGSEQELSPLLPKDKKIAVLTWSGNCLPWEDAVHMTRVAGMQNLNGGDSRFDPEYPNYASLAPIGREVGKERQIYSSSSNENTYTNLWSENFHSYRYLQSTLKNSESPVRLKPLNIYYHIYSGEREASLNALLSNLNYARTQDIAPITASHYTKIAQGFYDTQLTPLGADSWRVDKRGELETIRFDHHTFQSVDFERSKGVIGQRQYQGSLYVYLDQSVAAPVITLKDEPRYYAPPTEASPYLVESRWLVSQLHRQGSKVDFTAQGYGPGEMVWQVPVAGKYRISVDGKTVGDVKSDDRLLKVAIQQSALKPVHIVITPEGEHV